MVDTIKTVIASKSTGFSRKLDLKNHLIDAYLAQDKVEEALSVIQNILSVEPPRQGKLATIQFNDLRYELGMKLFTLGDVLNRPDLTNKGLDVSIKAFEAMMSIPKHSDGFFSSYWLDKITANLCKKGRYQDAEELIVKTVLNYTHKIKKTGRDVSASTSYILPDFFVQLTNVYLKAGKYQDVVALLNEVPWWGADDLAGIQEYKLLLIAAKALHAQGDDSSAEKILKSYLILKPKDDDAYRLLVDISGEQLIPWLDQLYAMDHFEERPLIWKAYILFQAGKLDDAEKVARQAIHIDPTDGEQKAGQRIYSYSLLADILAKKGEAKDAVFFRNVVNSVHIAEKGDALSKAGLIERSVTTYRHAMGIFADAYCIQWRLGERLYSEGDLEGSKKHYRLAFERMPEQFGRVASFCFGCEGAFKKMQSRSAAEEVFGHLLKTTPDNPQVYYLFALLRKAQKRIPEAYTFLKKAVELDPNYLDAWKEISEISSTVYLPQSEKDRIILKMLSLDPQQKHFSTDLNEILDWRNLWPILEKNQNVALTRPDKLYPLSASAALLKERLPKIGQIKAQYYYQKFVLQTSKDGSRAPGAILSRHPFLQTADYLVTLEKQ